MSRRPIHSPTLMITAMLALCLSRTAVRAQQTSAPPQLAKSLSQSPIGGIQRPGKSAAQNGFETYSKSALGHNPSCVFADDKAQFSFVGPDFQQANTRVDWRLIASERTLASGTSNATRVGDHENKVFYNVTIPTPPLHAGVVLSAKLKLHWPDTKQPFQKTHPVYLYSRTPFAAQQKFLEHAQIKLFDQDGKTAELLDANEIPHTRLLNLAAIDVVTEGILLVGESTSFRKQRRLAESLIHAASRGVSVLCLAPSEGDFPLAINGPASEIRPTQLLLAGNDYLRRYDKRFDRLPSTTSLSLEPLRNEVVIRATQEKSAWSWAVAEYATDKSTSPPGRLMICSLDIVSQWEQSPVPSYLFAHLLQDLAETPPIKEKQNDVFIHE